MKVVFRRLNCSSLLLGVSRLLNPLQPHLVDLDDLLVPLPDVSQPFLGLGELGYYSGHFAC